MPVCLHQVAPPRGERGLKLIVQYLFPARQGRSPSWGAWIEIGILEVFGALLDGRSPSWGAWIEIRIDNAGAMISLSLPLVGSVD